MMSALNCYLKAASCLEHSRMCHDDLSRAMWFETAKTWRNLACKAKAAEAKGGELGREDIPPDLDLQDPPVLLPRRKAASLC
ncbi:MAG: hypothetical protein J0H44_02295 [Alphaproteobacteria bacterium]|nr:hypothetical protein [Alphaproteobacteria bacterium]